MTTDDSTTIEGARLKIGPLLGNAADHTIAAPPMEWGIKLDTRARRRLLNSIKVGLIPEAARDAEYALGGASLANPLDDEWVRIEEALTEILAPPVRYVTGADLPPKPPHDTEINIHNAGWRPIPLEDQVPGANNLRPPGHPDLEPKPRPKPGAGSGMTINMTTDPQTKLLDSVNRAVEQAIVQRRRDRHSW